MKRHQSNWKPTIGALGLCLLFLAPETRSEPVAAAPDPLLLLPRHSADTNGDAFRLETAEATRVLNLWRAGRYGLNPAAPDGYDAGILPTNGLPHAADYLAPFWQLGYEEMVRFLALHRSSGYTYEASAADAFRPEFASWVYTPPAPNSTAGSTRYVSASSTNPTPPFATLETAALSLTDVLMISADNDLILVAPGVYRQGSVTNLYGVSRVAITAGVTVASMLGPELTIIEGASNGFVRGVMMHHPQASLSGFTIQQGTSHGNSTNMSARNGGGILVLAATNISHCVLLDNTSLPWGAGGGVSLTTMSGRFEKNKIYRNRAYNGGGVNVATGNGTILNRLEIFDNTVEASGGGISADNCRNMYNVVLYRNHSKNRGGGASLANNSELWNATVIGNTSANEGAGIYFSGSGSAVRNNIVQGNQNKDIFALSAANSVRFSAIPSGADAGMGSVSNVYEAVSFINTSSPNFRVRSGSPAIDRGEWIGWMNSAGDMDGRNRVQSTRPDMGAYEFNQPSVLAQPSAYTPGESVAINVSMSFPSGYNPLTFGVQVTPPSGWSLVGLSGNIAMEASPDGVGYVATGPLTQQVSLVITLLAATNATGPVPLNAALAWMTEGQEEVTNTGLQPAPYTIQPRYPVVAVPQQGGSVSSTGGWFAAGTLVELTATADAGWRFSGWTGDTNGATFAGSSITLPVSGAASVVAQFIRTFTLNISSPFGGTDPAIGTQVYDVGTPVTIRVLSEAVRVGQTSYVNVGWTGTGSTPTSGSVREASFVISENSSITWQWSKFQAQHATRGYRAAGRMASVIECDVWYEPSANITQIWWRPIIPGTWTIQRAEGDGNPVISGNLLLLQGDLSSGHQHFSYEVALPDDAQGTLSIGGEAGVNDPTP